MRGVNVVDMVFDFNRLEGWLGKLDKRIYDRVLVRSEMVFGRCGYIGVE